MLRVPGWASGVLESHVLHESGLAGLPDAFQFPGIPRTGQSLLLSTLNWDLSNFTIRLKHLGIELKCRF